MLEQDLNPAASKFISSLVRSLQILCNGQVEFNETIELVGHINVKIDHKFKFDYIVDEHVSKEGEDSSTTFLSNSYHSCRPAKQSNKKQNTSELEQDVIFSEIPKNTQKREKMEKNLHKIVEKSDCGILGRESNTQNYSVSIEPLDRQFNEPNQMVVKLEGGDDSNDCMVLPASPGEYEGEENRTESYPVPGPSSSFDDSLGNQTVHTRKKRKFNNQGADDPDSKIRTTSTGDMGYLSGSRIIYECAHCANIFNTEADFESHSEHCQFPTLSYCCSYCFFKAELRDAINIHIQDAHHIPAHQFACPICPSSFRQRLGLKKHMNVKHSKTAKFQCPFCAKFMYNKNDLDGHVNQHQGLKPHCCSYCGKAFCYKSSMGSHEKICSLRWPQS